MAATEMQVSGNKKMCTMPHLDNGIFLSIWSPNDSKEAIPLESALRSERPYVRGDLMGKMRL